MNPGNDEVLAIACTAVDELIARLSAERTDRRRERFVSMMAHDLRSPLSAIKAMAQLQALRTVSDPKDPAHVVASRIGTLVERMDGMIRELLDYGQAMSGADGFLRPTPGPLREIVAQTLAELELTHGPRFVLKAGNPVNGAWDGSAVRRIIQNLCGNAIKYGAPERPIRVSLERRPKGAELCVWNDGEPIPRERWGRLFEPYRGSRERREGWGLGLPLVRALASAHGGRVRLRSSRSAGTTFIITLQDLSSCSVGFLTKQKHDSGKIFPHA